MITSAELPRPPTVLNAGAGGSHPEDLPAYFAGWKHVRVDVDARTEPDLVASVTDLRAIPDGSVDAIWCAHCIEHLFAHDVPVALGEFRRVLNETGFACIIVPDIQSIADRIAEDRLHEVIYESSAGPVTAHDMIWGFGPAIERGELAMAHRCGFTPSLFLARLQEAKFGEIALRRRSNLELACVALRENSGNNVRRESLMNGLRL